MKLVYNGNVLACGTAFPINSLPICPLSREEYDALTNEEKEAEVIYLITDITINDTSTLSTEEYDTSDGWHVRKYSDGYIEMNRKDICPSGTPVDATSGLYYIRQAFQKSLYPVPLVERYTVTGTIGVLGGDYFSFCGGEYMEDSDMLTHLPSFFLMGATGNPLQADTICFRVATGRWK